MSVQSPTKNTLYPPVSDLNDVTNDLGDIKNDLGQDANDISRVTNESNDATHDLSEPVVKMEEGEGDPHTIFNDSGLETDSSMAEPFSATLRNKLPGTKSSRV